MEDVGAETTEEDDSGATGEDDAGTAEEDDDKTPPDDKGLAADDKAGSDEAEESAASAEYEESEPHPPTWSIKGKIAQKQRKRGIETCLNFNEIYKAVFAKIVATLKYRVKVVLCFCYID